MELEIGERTKSDADVEEMVEVDEGRVIDLLRKL